MTADDIIDIVCPLCRKPHKYLIEVLRSPYLFGSLGYTRIIKRLFTCPTYNEIFETTMEMKEDDRGTIVKVNILGLVLEDENGRNK